jgi:hypothetical protein
VHRVGQLDPTDEPFTDMARFAALVSAVPRGQKVKLRVANPVKGDFPAPAPDQRAA